MSTTETTIETADQPVNEPSKSRKKSGKKGQGETERPVFPTETMKLLDSLRGESSRADYLHKLLMEEKERQTNSVNEINETVAIGKEPETWFTTSKDETRAEVKEALGVETDDIIMTESEMLTRASELAGISVAEIQKQGRQYMGQKLITQFCKPRQGQGQAGSADSRLDDALEAVKKMIELGSYKPSKDGKISLTSVANHAMANYNSAKAWAIRRGYKEMFGLK